MSNTSRETLLTLSKIANDLGLKEERNKHTKAILKLDDLRISESFIDEMLNNYNLYFVSESEFTTKKIRFYSSLTQFIGEECNKNKTILLYCIKDNDSRLTPWEIHMVL